MKVLRPLLHLLSALVLGTLWFSALVTLWSAGLGLLITLLGLPVIWLTFVAAREAAALEAGLARSLLGADVAAPPRRRGWALLDRVRDGAEWRAQLYLLLRFGLGLGIACGLIAIWSAALGLTFAPAWYWSLANGIEVGLFNVNKLWLAIVMVPVGLALGVLAAWLTVAIGRGWRRLAEWLLPAANVPGSQARLPRLMPPLRVTIAVAAGLEALCLLLWALTGRTSAWPAWTAAGLFIPVGVQLSFVLGRRVTDPRRRWLAVDGGICATAMVVCLACWAIPGGGYFWPVWPLLGMAVALGLKALVRLGAASERRTLAPRMEQLTRTRAGAVDARDDELRRIERDLHDGAQARLVAVAMNLGLAEERLGRDPEGARELVAEAQQQARSAIKELRDLARGIAPPVLADRGLQAAVEALAATTPMAVTVTGSPGPRPHPAVERAAYFVAAEALANAAKHAGATRIAITLARTPDELTVEVADDGAGGADAEGAGLAGLRARVEAVDGRLEVRSASGAGTTIRASLPCASS